jgi:hypothetical protein
MITYHIAVYFQGRDYVLRVEKIKITRDIEEYKVSGKNRFIILQTDAPFIRSRALKYKSVSWKIVDGNPPQSGFLQGIIKAIELQ